MSSSVRILWSSVIRKDPSFRKCADLTVPVLSTKLTSCSCLSRMISLMYIPGCDKALLRVSEYAICSFSFRWLSPCRIFMESMAKTYEQYKDKG